MQKASFLPFFFIVPALFVICLTMLLPILLITASSFFDVSIDLNYRFIGIENFIKMFYDTKFLQSLINSVIFVGGSIAGHCIFGLLLAIALMSSVKFREIYRGIALIPWFLCDIMIGVCFIILFTQFGVVNAVLYSLLKTRINWLLSPEWAIWIVTLANIWKATSLYMCIDSSGLASIPKEIIESAELDGAVSLSKYRYVILPLIKPFVLLSLIVSAVGTFNYFGLILVMTRGGPLGSTTVPAFYMYKQTLEYFQIGYASAIGVFIFIVNMVIIALLRRAGAGLI